MNNNMTQSEFIKQYCERSKITEESLNKAGQFAIPCECEEVDCQGWAMISKEQLYSQLEFYL